MAKVAKVATFTKVAKVAKVIKIANFDVITNLSHQIKEVARG